MADKQDKSQTKPTSLQATIAGGFAGLSARQVLASLFLHTANTATDSV